MNTQIKIDKRFAKTIRTERNYSATCIKIIGKIKLPEVKTKMIVAKFYQNGKSVVAQVDGKKVFDKTNTINPYETWSCNVIKETPTIILVSPVALIRDEYSNKLLSLRKKFCKCNGKCGNKCKCK